MSDDRTVPPSPARLRRAWAAGLRPRSAWLWPAVAVGGLALTIDAMRSGFGPRPSVRPGELAIEAWLPWVVGWLAAIFVVTGLLAVLVAVLSRRLGGVSSSAARRLRPAAARPDVLVRSALGLLILVGLVVAARGVVAGAARSVDASEVGLSALWIGWAGRAVMLVALGLGLGAAVDLVIDRRDRIARLFQSRSQRRDDRRDGGGRAR